MGGSSVIALNGRQSSRLSGDTHAHWKTRQRIWSAKFRISKTCCKKKTPRSDLSPEWNLGTSRMQTTRSPLVGLAGHEALLGPKTRASHELHTFFPIQGILHHRQHTPTGKHTDGPTPGVMGLSCGQTPVCTTQIFTLRAQCHQQQDPLLWRQCLQ